MVTTAAFRMSSGNDDLKKTANWSSAAVAQDSPQQKGQWSGEAGFNASQNLRHNTNHIDNSMETSNS